jgi:hypothetical protein
MGPAGVPKFAEPRRRAAKISEEIIWYSSWIYKHFPPSREERRRKAKTTYPRLKDVKKAALI